MKISIEIEVAGLEQVLQKARGERSKRSLAMEIGMGEKSIQRIEGERSDRKDSVIPLETLLLVAGALEVDVMPAVIEAVSKRLMS